MVKDERSRSYLLGNTARNMLVPMAVQNIAKYMDSDEGGNVNKRKADNLLEYIKSGIPKYREDLIIKGSPADKAKLTIKDLSNPDVASFNETIKKSKEGYSEEEQAELTAEYAKGIKDLERQKEKGLIKEVAPYLQKLEKNIITDFNKEAKNETKEERLIFILSKAKSVSEKADILKEKFASYDEEEGVWYPTESLQSQENKLKRLLSKGVIGKDVEKEVMMKMIEINKKAKPN
jgi:hypothetical protein